MWIIYLQRTEVFMCLTHIVKVFVTFFFHQHQQPKMTVVVDVFIEYDYDCSALETHTKELSIVENLANFVKCFYQLWR